MSLLPTATTRNLAPYTYALGALFALNVLTRVFASVTAIQQSSAVSDRDLDHLLELDKRINPTLVLSGVTWVSAAIILMVWSRSAIANHRALGRPDDRPAKMHSPFRTALDFFGVAAAASRGITGSNGPEGSLVRKQQFSGAPKVRLWSATFFFAFAMTYLARLFAPDLSGAVDLDSMAGKLRIVGAIGLIQTAVLAVSGWIGLTVLRWIAADHQAATGDDKNQSGHASPF